MGINRNIVECKFCKWVEDVSTGKCVLIETLWNVNKYERLGKDLEEYSINRNIVECKFVSDFGQFVFNSCSINRNIVECKYSR